MTLGEIIKNYRSEHNWSMDDFARFSGLSKAYISILERDFNPSTKKPAVPSLETIKSVAQAMCVDFNDLIARLDGNQEISLESPIPPGFMPPPPTVKRPLVGRIACGQPILAEENIEDYLDVPAEKHIDFCLECVGDSMIEAGIQDGDIAYIRKQPTVENGQIAAVRIGDEATLKRVYRTPETLTLMPANGSYAPLVFTREEINTVCIEGKMVGFTHWL